MRHLLNALAGKPNMVIDRRAILAAIAGQFVLIASMYALRDLGVLTHDEFGFPIGVWSLSIRVTAIAWGAACLSWFPSRAAVRMVPGLGLRHFLAAAVSLVMAVFVEALCWVGTMAIRG